MVPGLIVICVPPLPLTLAPVTSIVSIVLSSDVFLIVILPLSASTASLKFRTIFALTAIPVALSAGVEDDRVGAVVSPLTITRSQVLSLLASLNVQSNTPFEAVTVPVVPAAIRAEVKFVNTPVYVFSANVDAVSMLKVVVPVK